MNGIRCLAALTALVAMGVQAHDSAGRYRVREVPAPATLQQDCLAAYSRSATPIAINDFGVVNANFSCLTQVDEAAGSARSKLRAFVASPWFDGFELPTEEPGTSFSYSLNNRGEAFGYEIPDGVGGLYGTKWSLGGGRERVFDDPACQSIRFSAAVDGNARYTIGWALRPNEGPFPIVLCLTTRWVIRDSAGVTTDGPMLGRPTSLNAFDVAVGSAERSAIRLHLPTGGIRVLHAADADHSAEARHINDLGEVAGRVLQNQTPDVFDECDPSIAIRWDRLGRERVLPHLRGATSSRAWAVGYDGETVGDSGSGQYCPFLDNSQERAVLWKGGRAHDLNQLIPRGSRVALTYAYAVNRRGQILVAGYDEDEPLTKCVTTVFDPATGIPSTLIEPCHNVRTYILTPAGRPGW
jgi:hypothetical protein